MTLAADHLDNVLPGGSTLSGSFRRACGPEGISPGKIKEIIEAINAQQHQLGSEILLLRFNISNSVPPAVVNPSLESGLEYLSSGGRLRSTDEVSPIEAETCSDSRDASAAVSNAAEFVENGSRRRRSPWGMAIAAIPLALGVLVTLWTVSPELPSWLLEKREAAAKAGSLVALTAKQSEPDDSAPTSQPQPPIQTLLSESFPSVFYGSSPDQFEFARLVPDRASLRQDTDFFAELDGTVYTYDMLANTAGVVREEWLPIIDAGLRRGVRYRLILSDYRDSNPFFGAFSEAVGEGDVESARASLIEHHRQLDKIINQLADDKKLGDDSLYRGSLTVKWNPRMLLYTMWLRDADRPEALCHFGMHLYRGKNYWPSLRLTRQTSPDYCENLREEFELAWKLSLDYDTIPLPPSKDGNAESLPEADGKSSQ